MEDMPLIIHPGETLADVLNERGISQVELAARAGVSEACIGGILAGKENISSNIAAALERALDVPRSFWLNLQANYDAAIRNASACKAAISKGGEHTNAENC